MMPSLAVLEGCNHWPARATTSELATKAPGGNLIGEVAAQAVSSGQVPTFYREIIMINDGSPERDIPGNELAAQGYPQTTNTSTNKLACWRTGRGVSGLSVNKSGGEQRQTGIMMMKMLHVIRLLLNRELFFNRKSCRRWWQLSIASITIICFCLASISANGISASSSSSGLGFAGPESAGEFS